MSAAKSPPPQIPGFTFSESIGGGGFADVFLYTQHSTGRGVAVKVLRAEHLSERSLRQFETEANVMAGVSAHPYIVTIHDAGVAPDGRPYLVMEHYPLPHFGRRAMGGHLPLAEVLQVSIQIASAVETAHRAQILHRDIKPANILTSAFGAPGLTDFGIAGVQTDGAFSAAAGVSLGFSAPEVVFDESATGSRASDVYGLGASVYALLTGRSPIYVSGGDNSAAAMTIRLERGDIQPIRRDDVPRSLEHLIHSTLAADPAQRPTTAESFARAIQDIEQQLQLSPTNLVLTGSQVSADRPSTPADEDGTRRRPRIVNIDPAIGQQGSHRAAPSLNPRGQGTSAGTPELSARASAGASAATAAGHGDTVARTGATGGAIGTVIAPDPVSETSRSRLPLATLPLAVIASLVVVGIVLAMVLTNDGGSTATEEDAMETRPSTVPDERVGPASVGTPGPPTLTPTHDGSALLQWAAPADLADGDAPVYAIVRSDLAEPVLVDEVGRTSVELPADLLTDADGSVCFRVRAEVLDTPSPWSEEACHPADAAAGAGSPGPGTP